MQYVACKFRAEDRRTYTYTYDGDEPLAIGDAVKVPDSRGEGWKRVEVASISGTAPPFPCKAILGKLDADGDAGPAPKPDASTGDPLDAEIPW